jgi:cob(I)alamin adenosyltransferase
MRIYTRTGDEGETGLFGGPRVAKTDPRVEAYGTVDELNSHLGWAIARVEDLPIAEDLRRIQEDLFVVGADLATPPGATEAAERRITRTDARMVERLEATIDRLDAEVPELDRFILPGGDEGAAILQVARTVSRRAERRVVGLAASEEVTPEVLRYVNRLSDLLFVAARWVNAKRGVEEPTWTPGAPPEG